MLHELFCDVCCVCVCVGFGLLCLCDLFVVNFVMLHCLSVRVFVCLFVLCAFVCFVCHILCGVVWRGLCVV